MASPTTTTATANPSHRQVSSTLPAEVVACLRNARFLHLATCDALYPHVSLMNYTYLASSPYSPHPTIIMTTDPSSKKTLNLIRNPRVALLVHDWVSHRPPSSTVMTTTTAAAGADNLSSPPPQQAVAATTQHTSAPAASAPVPSTAPAPAPPRSSLASLLLNLNTAAMSSISATINGVATLIEAGTEQERWLKQKHIENNTFGGGGGGGHGGGREEVDEDDDDLRGTFGGGVQEEEDGGRNCYIEGDQVRVVAVRVIDGRVADWKGGVKDWAVVDEHADGNGSGEVNGAAGRLLPNGV
ncbi:MAG: hypothetical protein M1816_000915 [Peltula sp. TS41687]|nr:MAG: hypothetical protein M1816_000915 [Peltula sp. TS41687]